MIRILFTIFFVCLVGLIFYLSWLPHHSFKPLWFMPDWLAEWANRYGNFRTSVPFFILGMAYELIMKDRNSWKKRIWVWAILLVVVCLSEIGQLFLPNRYPSFADVFWGNFGTITGMLAGGFINFVFTPEGE